MADQAPARDVFLQGADGAIEPLTCQPYAEESRLQELLEANPDLLGSSDIGQEPRRWLLVGREWALRDEDRAATRGFMDHLLLDQDATPTFVEVKRSSDSRIRRAVVGQLLDYAANGVAHTDVEEIRRRLSQRLGGDSVVEETLRDALGVHDAPQFWTKVETRLRAGDIRLLVVADRIPDSLLRIVEFLNDQMTTAECLAIEVRQYVGAGATVLVPRVLGQTQSARDRRAATRESRSWDPESFYADLEEKCDKTAVAVARAIQAWAEPRWEMSFGRGKQDGSMNFYRHDGEQRERVITVVSSGSLQLSLGTIVRLPAFHDPADQAALRDRLNQVPGIELSGSIDKRWPYYQLSDFADQATLEALQEALSDVPPNTATPLRT